MKTETKFGLTAKGKLLGLLGFDEKKADYVWTELEKFVASQAKHDKHPAGIPALVFDGGGVCITLQKK